MNQFAYTIKVLLKPMVSDIFNSRTIVTLVVAILLVAGYFWRAPEIDNAVDVPTRTSPSTTDLDEEPSDQARPPQETASTPNERAVDEWTPEALREVEELKNWQRAHGYFNASREFGRLSDSELEPFIKSGDVGALQEIADRRSIKDPRESIAYFEQAAVYGSTSALVRAGHLHSFFANREVNTLVDSDDQNMGSSMALGYLLAAQMAGDDLAAGIATEEALNKTEYTDEMKTAACQQAQAIIDRLQHQRLQIGLSDFDLTPAPRGFGVPPGATVADICGR
jgi:hypothetical protein